VVAVSPTKAHGLLAEAHIVSSGLGGYDGRLVHRNLGYKRVSVSEDSGESRQGSSTSSPRVGSFAGGAKWSMTHLVRSFFAVGESFLLFWRGRVDECSVDGCS
jgi:hypothetical protein